jgi:cytochrome c-type biogenesis protein CcmH
MMFWVLAVLITLVAAVFIAWPLLKERAALRNYGLALALLVPVASLVLYQMVGTPEGISVVGSPGQTGQPSASAAHPGAGSDMGMESMVASLEQRLQQNPGDLEGWVLLGRSYKAMQQYIQAEIALTRALQLAPADALVLVELAEAKMFTSGSPDVSEEVQGMLVQAVDLDPNNQKGLWLLGLVAAQQGDDPRALELWGRLVSLLEPGSPTLASVEQQMSQLRQRSAGESAPIAETMSEAAEAALEAEDRLDPATGEDDTTPSAAWAGLRVDVTAPADLSALPPGAALFVILRNPAMPGPPLGVARMMTPTFPAIALLSDANSMMEGMPISGVQEVDVLARLSMSGSPVPGPGDLESDTVRVNLASTQQVRLGLISD